MMRLYIDTTSSPQQQHLHEIETLHKLFSILHYIHITTKLFFIAIAKEIFLDIFRFRVYGGLGEEIFVTIFRLY
jgi:hypothetical protein